MSDSPDDGAGVASSSQKPVEGDENARTPEDAFELLGHEVRLGIIRELERTRIEGPEHEGLSFADLKDAVGVRDAGKFNYHLGKLEGAFVRKDDGEYLLTPAGMRVAGAIRRGTYASESDVREEVSDVPCPSCDESLVTRYRNGSYEMACPSEGVLFTGPMPPGFVRGRTLGEGVDHLLRRIAYETKQAVNGLCRHCHGDLTTTIPAEMHESWKEGFDYDAKSLVQFDCSDCGISYWFTVGACLGVAPEVVAFCREVGLPEPTISSLTHEAIAPGGAVTVELLDGDPTAPDGARIEATIRRDDVEFVAWLGEAATVVTTERR